jgi:UDP-N-acetylmuramate: L-alanyl-gamma-D-glutamyl-meso-diaminopimelate ligase
MSALAIAFKNAGYIVTGSDAGFFPPISTELEKNQIDFYPGWHAERVLHSFSEGGQDGNLVVVGNVASSTNPEWIYVQEHKLNYKSYPEVIAEFFIKPHSIVCAGTYGKTSSSALLSWVLTKSGFDPSYMFGGLTADALLDSARIGNNNWSVLEGDEYKSARWDMRPKFAHYKPTHLLLTGLAWDHADVYPTEEAYFDAFKKLILTIPKDGVIVADTDNKKIADIVPLSHCSIVSYGKNHEALYQYSNIAASTDGITFDIFHNGQTYHIESPMLGDYQAANMTGCFAMAMQAGILPEQILSSIKHFRGMKRRLEKRYEGDITVFDDIAHSPTKAKATLETLRNIYTGKILAVFEPNTGNRQSEAIPQYDHAFARADIVLIPKLTTVKKSANGPEPIDGTKLKDIISNTHHDTRYIEDDTLLIKEVITEIRPGDVVVFLGSHGFRGMIESLVEQIQAKNYTDTAV